MLHTCVQKFDVTENLEKFCKILRTKQPQKLKLSFGKLSCLYEVSWSMPFCSVTGVVCEIHWGVSAAGGEEAFGFPLLQNVHWS